VDTDRSSAVEGLRRAALFHELDIPEIVAPEDHDVVVNRHRFHYLAAGNEGAPTLLFLHGAALTAHTWDLVALSLSDSYRCIALDLRGHGDSEWSPEMDYSLEANVRDVEGFVEYLGPGKLVVIGLSLGGMTGLLYAGSHADRLDGIVIVDIGPQFNVDGARRIRQFSQQQHELDSVDAFIDQAMEFNPTRDPELLRSSLLHNLRKLPNDKWTWKYDRRHWERTDFNGMSNIATALSDAVPRVTCPSLVVRGETSEVFSAENAEELASNLPHARWVEVPRAGHTVHGDNPGTFSSELRAFLTEIHF